MNRRRVLLVCRRAFMRLASHVTGPRFMPIDRTRVLCARGTTRGRGRARRPVWGPTEIAAAQLHRFNDRTPVAGVQV
jgi:hypothetical protein